MVVLKHNLNITFLGVLVIIIILGAAATIYSNYSLSDLSNKQSKSQTEIEKLELELAAQSADLEETSEQLVIRKEREEDLSTQFTDVSTENKNLKDENEALQNDLSIVKKENADLEIRNADLTTKNSDLEKDVLTLKNLVDDEVIEYEIVEAIPQGKLFSTFVDMQILFRSKMALMAFSFDFMPSSVEVIEPEKFEMDNDNFSSWLNELQAKLHQITMGAREKTLISEQIQKELDNVIRYNMISHLSDKPLTKESLRSKVGLDEKGFERFLSLLIQRGDIIQEGDLLKVSPSVQFENESEEQS